LITCNLTKPENTLDQVKKAYPKLQQTDAALMAIALFRSGKYARAVFQDKEYSWPDDVETLTKALLGHLSWIQEQLEPAAKRTKASPEEEPVEVQVQLSPNLAEGERVLANNETLKTLLSDILAKGVEYQFGATDIGWQWALDRTNWTTLSEGALTRRVKLKTVFLGEAVGTEMGVTGQPKKRQSKRAAAPAPPAAPEPVPAEPRPAEAGAGDAGPEGE
jgi:hypothetical protein